MRTGLFVLFVALTGFPLSAADWPQFRGPGGTARSNESRQLPARIGPGTNVVWKTALAKGHSSPVVADGRIFLTALQDAKLLTLALDVESGERLWQAEAPYEKLERVHRIGSPATPSVATQGDHVVSFFGSSGLFCYDRDGNERWRVRMGPFDNSFGAASSPVIADDRVLLCEDHDTGSFLACFDLQTGEELWRTERPRFRRNYGTPVVWETADGPQVVTAGTSQVAGYDLRTGELRWFVRGICRVVSSSPVAGDDGRLYVAATGGGSAPPQPTFEQLVRTRDADGNGLMEKGELPKSPIKSFFGQFDRDKDGHLNEEEYESIRRVFAEARSVALRIRPGGEGDVTESHVEWSYSRNVPRNSSPVLAAGRLFFVKDGGVLVALDAQTGKTAAQLRLPGNGKYFSSPVVGDVKLYVADDRGRVSIVATEGEVRVLSSADLEQDVYATPAIAGGRLYVRSVETLWCFGLR